MLIRVHEAGEDGNCLKGRQLEGTGDIRIGGPCRAEINCRDCGDGRVTVDIIYERTGNLVYWLELLREPEETFVEYNLKIRQLISGLVEKHRNIRYIISQ